MDAVEDRAGGNHKVLAKKIANSPLGKCEHIAAIILCAHKSRYIALHGYYTTTCMYSVAPLTTNLTIHSDVNVSFCSLLTDSFQVAPSSPQAIKKALAPVS